MSKVMPVGRSVTSGCLEKPACKFSYREARQVMSLADSYPGSSGGVGPPGIDDPDVDPRRVGISYEPENWIDDVLEEDSVEPAIRGLVLFIVFVVASVGGIILSTILALFSGFSFLPTLAVYYAVANAIILGTVVIVALLDLADDDHG